MVSGETQVADNLDERARARRQQTAYRRGVFPAADLYDWAGEDYAEVDKQCFIRFPPDVSAKLKERFCRKEPLGLVLTPTERYDYRGFDVKVEGIGRELSGILLELPCITESHKTLNGDLFFKSADISQIMIVYDEKSRPDIEGIRDKSHWEWKSGLTPATHRLRVRKFKNFDVFDRQEIREAELEVIDLLNSSSRDSYEVLTHTESEMISSLEKFRKGESSYRVISATDDLEQMLQDDGYQSDASDAMFGLDHAQGYVRKITFSSRGFGRRPPGRPPGRGGLGRGTGQRRPKQGEVEGGGGLSAGVRDAGQPLRGQAPGSATAEATEACNAAEEKERRRQEKKQRKFQRKEKKRLKKEKKKIRKEMKKAKKEKLLESQGKPTSAGVAEASGPRLIDESEVPVVPTTAARSGKLRENGADSEELEDNESNDSSSDSSEDLSLGEEDVNARGTQLADGGESASRTGTDTAVDAGFGEGNDAVKFLQATGLEQI